MDWTQSKKSSAMLDTISISLSEKYQKERERQEKERKREIKNVVEE